ncbi:RNA pseudouridine synthase [Vibrio harveyi]|nr:RNA pseudouridine synthase [Vibrio harveyi]
MIKKNLILVKLITGRKHQIRAMLSYLKNPILNDFRYGGKKINDEKIIYLSASKLIFHNLDKPLDYLNEKIIEFIPK